MIRYLGEDLAMKAKLLGLLTALALVGISHAQQTDPYAEGFRNQSFEHYRQKMDSYLNLVRNLYFADGCSVFVQKGADAYRIYYPTYYQLLLEGVEITGHDVAKQLFDQTEAAKRDGRARASQPGGCDYWHQHPEAVYQMRRAAGIAMP